MGLEVIQTGRGPGKKPRTSNQTGNRAPKFPWSSSRIGRTARIVIFCCALHLGYKHEEIVATHKFPSAKDLADVFNRIMPWFRQHYNQTRLLRIKQSGYQGPYELFGPEDVQNRLRYYYATPGSKQHTKGSRERSYGMSKEHHDSTEQFRDRLLVFEHCSVEVCRRLREGGTISIQEALEWGSKGWKGAK